MLRGVVEPSHVPPTLLVEGTVEREVEPDRVTIAAQLRSGVATEPSEALEATLAARSSLRDVLAVRHPSAAVSDTAVRVERHMVERKERTGPGTTETQWVHAGYIGWCRVAAGADAADAAGLVATFVAADDGSLESPVFTLSPALERTVSLELDCEAIRDAHRRAEAMAEAAGCRIAGILSIGESPRRDEGIEPRAFAAKPGYDAMAVADDLTALIGELRPEPVRVIRSVPVRFLLVPADGDS